MSEEIIDDSAVDPAASPAAPAPAADPPKPVIADEPTVESDELDAEADQDHEQPAADSDYNLAPVIIEDESIPQEYRNAPETAEALTEVGGFAKEAGIKPALAKTLVAAYASLALFEQDHLPDIQDDEAVQRYMSHQYGPAEAKAIITAAQEATRALGPKFSQWLDRTRLGSHPSMLLLLSALTPKDGLFKKNTPQQARDAMKKFRADPKHPVNSPGSKGYTSARAQWRLLSALANMDDGSAKDGGQSERASEQRDRQAEADRKAPPKTDPARVKLESEARALMMSNEYRDRTSPAHRQVANRVREIFQTIYKD